MRLSSDDPDIKRVQFNVNINKEFKGFENPQYKCTVPIPRQRRWSCEFEKQLLDEDIVYTWLMVTHNHVTYTAKKNPFSVGALRRGERNYILTTTSTTWSPIDDPNHRICDSAVTVLQNGGVLCKNQLIFEDNFEQFNNNHWTNEIRIPLTGLDSKFVIYNGSLSVNNGVLKIEASEFQHSVIADIDLGNR